MLTALATRGKLDSYGPIPDKVNVENDNDIIYYIMDGKDITTEHIEWNLYKRPDVNSRFVLVDSKKVNNGDIKINLHKYGLQYENNQYLLKVALQKNGFLIGETSFWYYYLKYTRIPKVVPYHIDSAYLQYQGGGGMGMGVAPIYKEKPFPTITIQKFCDDEDNINNINISIRYIKELNL